MSADLVEKALELLCGKYIFADRAQEAADGIRRRLAAGDYDRLDEEALGERLTAELFEVCQDKHLRVRTRAEDAREALTESELEAVWREQQRLGNYGIARVERAGRQRRVATTFSGGEEICYNLQAQGRAVLVGETTRGGAHPTEAFPITATFEITVPVARSVNPVTGSNWEGTGVRPDVAVPAGEAFEVAYRRALQHVLAGVTSPAVRAEARSALE